MEAYYNIKIQTKDYAEEKMVIAVPQLPIELGIIMRKLEPGKTIIILEKVDTNGEVFDEVKYNITVEELQK